MTTLGWESGLLSQLLAPARVTVAPVDSQSACPAWASVLPFCETGRGAGSLSVVRRDEILAQCYGLNCVPPI